MNKKLSITHFFIGLSSMNTQTLLQTQTETEVNNY